MSLKYSLFFFLVLPICYLSVYEGSTPPRIEYGIIFQFLGNVAKMAKNSYKWRNHWLRGLFEMAKKWLKGG